MPQIAPEPQAFKEAIDYFQDKVRLPTRTWTDLWEGMHARAFVVAGAVKDQLLADFQEAIAKALKDGTTLAEFRKDFDRIVAKHGWSYNGTRGWRSRVIYNTNLRMAYSAGRWQQIQRQKDRRLYVRYVAILDHRTRPEHQQWHDTVLPADHEFWASHAPPNGWNCRCSLQSLSERDVKRHGLKVAPGAPPSHQVAKKINTPAGPQIVQVPNGIDPGFAYNVGEAAWGNQLSTQAMGQWRAMKGQALEAMTPRSYLDHGRPEAIPVDPLKAKLTKPGIEGDDLAKLIADTIGGDEKVLFLPNGTAVNVNAKVLAEHIDPDRSRYVPALKEMLEDPFEVWLSFQRHKGTGKVYLRTRTLKAIQLDKKGRYLVLVAESVKGQFTAWTFIPVSKRSYINKQRTGILLYGRDE